jgi:hypothetical protein
MRVLVFDISEFTRDATKVFDAALTDEVIVSSKDGSKYRILPLKNDNKAGKSPFEDIPCITADITTQEIVELLRESRAGV